jgi:hypothetical protein
MEPLMTILVVCLVFCIIFGIIQTMIPIAPPFKNWILGILGLIFIVYLLHAVGFLPSFGVR